MIGVSYGLGIYYFLPLALLSFNFALILQIFFAILLGMLFGLSLLAFNLQRFVELILVYVLLFWERKSMRQMIFKNLAAHKLRNKMTSIIFSIAIGFIIFLVVIYNLQVKSAKLQQLKGAGAHFRVDTDDPLRLKPAFFDPILRNHAGNIESFAYWSSELHGDPEYGVLDTVVSDKAKVNAERVNVQGMQPTTFDVTLKDYLSLDYTSGSGLSLGEQLYSKRGSQSVAVGSYLTDLAAVDPANHKQAMLLTVETAAKGEPNRFYRKRPLWTANSAPAFLMVDRKVGRDRMALLMSFPLFNFLVAPHRSQNQTRYNGIFIKFKGEGGTAAYKA